MSGDILILHSETIDRLYFSEKDCVMLAFFENSDAVVEPWKYDEHQLQDGLRKSMCVQELYK